MAFWGVEVKPGKPFTHSSLDVKGRLRISQATLGIGSATTKSLVQCNVGNKSPVLLCVLVPDKTESCHLELEFEEAEDVVFSVIGPRSVYLTGYYVTSSRHYNMNSDTESYGEDIANSEESNHCSDDDEYEDSFINDDEPEVLTPSPVSSDGDMETSEDEKPKEGKRNRKRLKKRCQVIESEEDNISEGSEEEEDYTLSELKSNSSSKTLSSIAKGNTDKLKGGTGGEAENATSSCELKEQADAERVDDVSSSLLLEKKDKKQTCTNELDAVNSETPKKKRKERSKDVKILEADNGSHKEVEHKHAVDNSGYLRQDPLTNCNHPNPENDMEVNGHSAEMVSRKGLKSKKRRKKSERDTVEGNDAERLAVKGEQNKKGDGCSHKMGKDVPIRMEESQPPNSHRVIGRTTVEVSNGCLTEKKIKKTKKKSTTQDKDESIIAPVDENLEKFQGKLFSKLKNKNVDATTIRTLSNGLTIEDLEKGEPDGKIATTGRKVKIFYTAMLKENGHIFDSKKGKRPFKFRLGDKEVIDGWNLGIDGMRAGDKRRLVIPPSMGYGSRGAGENVPPNSWLVYEVELVGVQ